MWLATKCGRGNPSPTIWVHLYCASLIVLALRLGKNPFGVALLRFDWSCVIACINNNIAQLLAKWLNFGIKVGNLGQKTSFWMEKWLFSKSSRFFAVYLI